MCSYMEDCIHLKACRRYQLLVKQRLGGGCIGRHCDKDCTAYQSSNLETNYVSEKTALEYARDGVYDIQNGYGMFDVYCTGDMECATLGEILEECEDE